MKPTQSSKKIAEVNFLDTGVKSQKKDAPKPLWTERDADEQEFLKIKMDRISVLWEYAQPAHQRIRENILLMSGKSVVKQDSGINDVVEVMPIVRAFIEAKTAEEIKVMTGYKFTPKQDSRKAKFAYAIESVDNHVKKVTHYKANQHALKRQKNIFGVSIKRKGYRYTEQYNKIPVEWDENNVPIKWEVRKVPVYDDLFEEIVSPLQFAVDPNCTTLNDAEDCYTYSYISFNKYQIQFQNNPFWVNTDKVVPGAKFTLNQSGDFVYDKEIPNDGVLIEEYFNVSLNEWVVIGNGVLLSPLFKAENINGKMDTFCQPLRDEHMKLPFIAYHNDPSFISESFTRTMVENTGSDQVTGLVGSITGKQSFWTNGDPYILKDLISLETGLTKAMFRNAKLASQTIIATDRGYKFKSKKWKSGDQAIGMKGRFEVVSLAQTQQSQVQPLLDHLFQMKVLALGLDPRNISQDNKTKSATEAAIIQDTSMRRLSENIEFNVQNGELRDAEITLSLIRQYYSIKEIVRLSGNETVKELEMYDDVEYVDTKKEDGEEVKVPVIGRKYRSIASKRPVKEVKKKGQYLLQESKTGNHSFLMRPEYGHLMNALIELTTENRLGEIKAVVKHQSNDLINTYLTLLNATQPGADGKPGAVSKEELPPLKSILKRLMQAHDLETEWEQQSEELDTETVDQRKVMDEYMKASSPMKLSPAQAGPAEAAAGPMSAMLSSSPNVNENISTAA